MVIGGLGGAASIVIDNDVPPSNTEVWIYISIYIIGLIILITLPFYWSFKDKLKRRKIQKRRLKEAGYDESKHILTLDYFFSTRKYFKYIFNKR